MSVVTIDISDSTHITIAEFKEEAGLFSEHVDDALNTAAFAGAENVRSQLVTGKLRIHSQNPATGLVASIFSWRLRLHVMMIGVPSNTPASAYAQIQNDGGRIVPRKGKALAIPISREAKSFSSPRQMDGLTILPRKGRNPLLVRILNPGANAQITAHWALVPSVTIRATHFLDDGVDNARGNILTTFEAELSEEIQKVLG